MDIPFPEVDPEMEEKEISVCRRTVETLRSKIKRNNAKVVCQHIFKKGIKLYGKEILTSG